MESPREGEEYIHRLIRTIQLFLERSQTAPLTLHRGLIDLGEAANRNMLELLDLVARTGGRWKTTVILPFDESLLDESFGGRLSHLLLKV